MSELTDEEIQNFENLAKSYEGEFVGDLAELMLEDVPPERRREPDTTPRDSEGSTDEDSERLSDPAVAECRLNGRLLYRLEQRRETDLSALEAAAVITSLRSLADGLEASCLDRQAEEVLAEVDVDVRLDEG